MTDHENITLAMTKDEENGNDDTKKNDELGNLKKQWNGNPRKEWVTLNVGGTKFLSTRLTLCKDPESFFSQCLDSSDMTLDKDDDGAYLIDRDPTYFVPVLNYLRHGKLVMDKNLSEEGVLEEAVYFNMVELVKMIKEKMAGRDREDKKHVYRVLQCHEDELTQMISTLTDGWKFEQVINSGSGYQYGNGEQTEFLCVVSRACTIVNQNTVGKGKEASDRGKVLQQLGSRM